MKSFTYLELFAGTGIGGMALEKVGGVSVGYSEYDKDAVKNYNANFPNRVNFGDITKIVAEDLPNFDVLIGGSPCQNISIARAIHYEDNKVDGLDGVNSRLFFDYLNILNTKLPNWFIFENVKNLLSCNEGADWEIVKAELSVNYNIKFKLMNTADYGIPQVRNRIYVVGQRKDLGDFNFEFPQPRGLEITAFDLLENQVDDKYYLSEKMYKYVMSAGTKSYNARPEADLKVARTLTATMHKMHRAGIDNYYHTEYKPVDKTNLRRLTPRECARLQGLSDDYKIVVSDTQAYRMMGNAMSLNVVESIAEELIKIMGGH